MKIVAHETIEYEVWFTDEEASWPKDYLQNRLVEETVKDSNMHQTIFNALKVAGVDQ